MLAPIGSGLHLAELLRVRVGDLGSLDVDARLLPDPEAELLAVRYQQRRGRQAERITFLSFAARTAVLEHLARRRLDGLDTGPESPLVAGPDGRPAGRAEVAPGPTAQQRHHPGRQQAQRRPVPQDERVLPRGEPGSRFTPVPQKKAF